MYYYGAIIGSHFANSPTLIFYRHLLSNLLLAVFPNRVGRVVLDGVDPWYHVNKPAHKVNTSVYASKSIPDQMWSIGAEPTDEAFTRFVSVCDAARHTGCAIATEGSTADSLCHWTCGLLDGCGSYAYSFLVSNVNLRLGCI